MPGMPVGAMCLAGAVTPAGVSARRAKSSMPCVNSLCRVDEADTRGRGRANASLGSRATCGSERTAFFGRTKRASPFARARRAVRIAAAEGPAGDGTRTDVDGDVVTSAPDTTPPPGAEVDLGAVFGRFKQVASPFWTDPKSSSNARWLLAGVVGLTLGTTAISVGFNFLGRDFYNSIAEKQPEEFDRLLKTYIAVIAGAIPVFVMRDYYQSVLVLKWRAWMTEAYVAKYLDRRNFYHIQTGSIIDNPDQRIVDDIANFTSTSLGLGFTILNAGIDLVSFSGILLGIYKPLVGVLFVYSLGGTLISAKLGQPLVGLNFAQEAREADFRYGLVRVRENAESIAFYRGEAAERSTLVKRLRGAVDNFGELLKATRSVDFFTSFYRYMVTFLPAAVVAPLYFRGEIEFGVINQSSSAFSHILGDVSLVVYQIERLASFSAVTDRLGQMTEVLETPAASLVFGDDDRDETEGAARDARRRSKIARGPVPRRDWRAAADEAFASAASALSLSPGVPSSGRAKENLERSKEGSKEGSKEAPPPRLFVRDLTVRAPGRAALERPPLVEGLDLTLAPGGSLLVMGPSGAGKTSLLRAVAGLWEQGTGEVRWTVEEDVSATERERESSGNRDVADDAARASSDSAPNASTDTSGLYFLPQRPYLALGTLRQQLLYPTWVQTDADAPPGLEARDGALCGVAGCPPTPSDAALVETLERVNLGYVLARVEHAGKLDATGDWSSMLSLGEQQRLAFARVLLAQPPVAILDEATSALDAENEAQMYALLRRLPDTAFVSVGHRASLLGYHDDVLRLEGRGGAWRVVSAEAYKKEVTALEEA